MIELSRTIADFAVTAAWQSGLVSLAALLLLPLLHRASARLRHALLVTALIASALVLIIPRFPEQAERLQPTTTAKRGTTRNVPGDAMIMRVQVNKPPIALVHAVAALYLLLVGRAVVALARSFHHASRLRRTAAIRTLDHDEREALASATHALGAEPVAIAFSDQIAAPVTVGILRPLILLPSAQPVQRDALVAVLGHELAHVRRHDALVQLVIEIVSLPLAFHPLVALLRRQAAIAREVACDELVTPALVESRHYARVLLSIAEQVIVPRCSVAFGPAAALEARLQSLRRVPMRRGLLAVTVAGVIVLTVAVIASRSTLHLFGSGRAALAGRWVLDRGATDFGVIAPYQAFAHSIAYDGERLKSWQTRVRNGRRESVNWQVRADGMTRKWDVGGIPGSGSARWEGATLVLELQHRNGHWERTRAMLADPDTLICNGEVRERGGGGRFRFVFRRVKEKRS
jgi:beta-lactamase regulating signal transducer with metallopeptidase domain